MGCIRWAKRYGVYQVSKSVWGVSGEQSGMGCIRLCIFSCASEMQANCCLIHMLHGASSLVHQRCNRSSLYAALYPTAALKEAKSEWKKAAPVPYGGIGCIVRFLQSKPYIAVGNRGCTKCNTRSRLPFFAASFMCTFGKCNSVTLSKGASGCAVFAAFFYAAKLQRQHRKKLQRGDMGCIRCKKVSEASGGLNGVVVIVCLRYILFGRAAYQPLMG